LSSHFFYLLREAAGLIGAFADQALSSRR